MKLKNIVFALLLLTTTSSCGFLFGSKQDDTIDDILQQGSIDPNLIPNKVGYVPILPIWKDFNAPVDVYVGYDEMVYVCDQNGVHIIDQKGDEQRLINIQGATDVVQDRRLFTYILGKITKNVNGQNYQLAAVFKIANASGAGTPIFVDTLIHPFNDASRNTTNFRGVLDEQVAFTGIGTLHNNEIYLARTGPTNQQSAVARPDNTILFYDENLANTGSAVSLNSSSSSLKSMLNISALTTFAAPPQSAFGINASPDFLMLQTAPQAEYKVLWIKQTYSADLGYDYTENAGLLNYDTSKASGFLYQSFRFGQPADICVAPDETGYIFVVDAQKDSLFQFTNKGFEGVNPPANSGIKKQIIASFGGRGAGVFQLNQPSGVAYFKRVVYIADKGNNRIIRYKLSTDLEK